MRRKGTTNIAYMQIFLIFFCIFQKIVVILQSILKWHSARTSKMANKRKIINDPVFGFLSIPNDLVYDVLQHPYVQRLNRIRQLGLSYLVYPGAMHSRFGHSIGAMHLMQEAISSLRLKGVEISAEEETSAMIAILLHDIGHGPFSHVLEHTLVEGVTHEEISLLMMERINEDLSRQPSAVSSQKPLDMAISIFKNEYPKHFLHQLISSQLDVDRMDYLCRDSFFTGVQEGRVASERLLKMLDVRDDRLVVQIKGIYSVEKFLVARRLMYWQVYLHKTSVAAEQHLIKILSRAKELARSRESRDERRELFCSPALRYFLYQPVTFEMFGTHSEALEQYALLDDNDVLCAIKAWISSEDKVLSKLSESFINRSLFRGELLDAPLTDAQKKALNQQYAEALGISEEEAAYCWSEHVSTSNTYSEKADSIDILYNDGTVRDIAEASEILDLEALTRKPIKRYVFKYRI